MFLKHVESGPDGEPTLGVPTLLLVHPMGADATFWDACRAVWSQRLRCVAVDLRKADHALSIEDHAADLEAFRCDRGLAHVVPVGCAVGAMVATAYAGMYPASCRALVLSNPGYRIEPQAREALSGRAARACADGMAAIAPGVIDKTFLGCPDDERKMLYRERFSRLDPSSYALEIEGMLHADTSRHLATVDCPTLIVAGGNDRLLPAEHADRIAAALPGSELVLVEEGAHFIPYQRPAQFAALVEAFLERKTGLPRRS